MTRFSALATILGVTIGVAPILSQSLPTLRQLGPVTAVAGDSLGAVSGIRTLSNGRVLVNDIVGRRVLLFDSALTLVSVVADTTSATANAYGTRAGGLIAFRGDSTLFVDPASLSMMLIDPDGKIGRVMSAPRAQDIGFLIGGPFGAPGFDPSGKLVYRAPPDFRAIARGPAANGLPPVPTPPESAAVVRFDLASRKVDTATFFKTPKVVMNVTRTNDGGVRVLSSINPLPQGDDWALLPDGTIAIVRTKDFHVDFLSPDGKVTSAPKIPFSWERLTDSGKVAFIDSARVAIEKQRASGQFGFGGGPGGGGGLQVTFGAAGPARGGGAGGDRANVTTTAGPPAGQLPPLTMIQPTELPDYKPAFLPGSTRVDSEGNLWIRTTQNVDARPVYDVVNRKGELVDRVQLPANRVLVGFGAGGVAYLAVRDGNTVHLERAR
ncbi:MAG TPA: hypothetical protein VJ840_16110, partial [Gemmatimonadaceae bacterium]|nr:hypothetical protein [Gemmatimonadaceae bacterium]